MQHKGAVLGHAAANRMPTLRDRAAKLREDPRERVRRWRLHYFVDCCRLIQFTTILEMRLGVRAADDNLGDRLLVDHLGSLLEMARERQLLPERSP